MNIDLKFFFALALLTLNFAGSAHAALDASESDSGVKYSPYATVVQNISKAAAQFPQQAKFVEYGKTVKGRPLTLIRIGNPSPTNKPRHAIEISGAIHGNEYLGIEEKMALYFLNHSSQMPGLTLFLASGGMIYFVPVINPDGYESRNRENAKGTDLNRDFDIPDGTKRFVQPEMKALTQYLDQEMSENQLKLSFSLDYHCCMGALIMPWGYKNFYPKQSQLSQFNQIAELEKSILGYPYGNPMDTVGYNAPGGSIDYFFAKYGTLAFAIEGEFRGEQGVLNKHLKFLDSIFEMMAKENFR